MTFPQRISTLAYLGLAYVGIGLVAALFARPSLVSAGEFEWFKVADDLFLSASPWNLISGTGSAPPADGDTALFNQAGVYTVTLDDDHAIGELRVEAGGVTFRSFGRDRSLSVNGDALFEGGDLALGVSGDPLDLKVDKVLRVRDGSLLQVLHGSEVNVNDQLRVGAHSSGNGTLNVIGSGSLLTTSSANTTVVGGSGSMGTLSIFSSATANIGDNLHIAASAVSGSSGSVNVSGGELRVSGDINMTTGTNTNQTSFLAIDGGGEVTANGNLNIGTGTSTSQSAFLSVTGSAASFRQNGAGSIDIGGAAAANNFARLDVNGGSFTSGTGTIHVHETGVLDTASGMFIANGPVVLDAGSNFLIEEGSFDATAGIDNSAGGTVDVRNGLLKISGGEFITTPAVTLNEDFTFSGTAPSERPKLMVTSGGLVSVTDDLILGDNGFDADMEITAGGRVDSEGGNIAGDAGSSVDILVTGEEAFWNARALVGGSGNVTTIIGGDGDAGVIVEEGGRARVSGVLGSQPGGRGTVSVRDPNSRWEAFGMDVGSGGVGSFTVVNDALATMFSLDIGLGASASSQGTVTLITGGTIDVSQDIHIGGSAAGAGGGSGLLNINSGHVITDGTLKIWAPGTVRITFSSTLSADTIDHTEGGTFDFDGGTLQVNSFLGDLVNQAGRLAPGPDAGPTAITGNLTHQGNATLVLDIGGTSPGGTHDVVTVSGLANIDGDLELSLLEGYVPEPGDVFTVLSATTLNGFFDNIFTGQRLDVEGGEGSFVVNYGVGSAFSSNQIVLSDFLADVDLDDDSDVDGADFLAIQRTNPALTSAWESQFGDGVAPLAGSTAVPEPSALMLLLAALALRPRRVR